MASYKKTTKKRKSIKQQRISTEIMLKYWKNVDKQENIGDDACYVWTGTTRKTGRGGKDRGILYVGKTTYSPYLLAIVGTTGCIASSLTGRHYTCKSGNSLCVRGDHLVGKNGQRLCKFCGNESEFDTYMCHSCRKIYGNNRTRELNDGVLYKSSRTIIQPGDVYIVKACEICTQNFYPQCPAGTRCDNCWKVAEKVRSCICATAHRSVVRGEIKLDPPTNECAVLMTRRFIASTNCEYCDCEFDEHNLRTIDHKVPVSRGGTNVVENLAICCRRCNLAKNALTLEEWIELSKRIIDVLSKKIKL